MDIMCAKYKYFYICFTDNLTDVNLSVIITTQTQKNEVEVSLMESGLESKIIQLKKQKNAVILAHYYAPMEVQKVADFVGDSFYLAKIAKDCDAGVLVFCGVAFMGESAKILNPKKTVIMPDLSADCPMAHMVEKGKIQSMRDTYEDLAVVCYINSTAELKLQSDVCVTSSNAVKIVKALPNKNVFFIPDRNLGRFVAEQVPEKNIIINDGCCPVHAEISAEQVKELKAIYPSAKVLTHPECEQDIIALSDFVGSTSEIIDYARKSECMEFIICTEDGVEFKLKSDNLDKKFYFPKNRPCCEGMKLNTLEKLYYALKNQTNCVEVDGQTRIKAMEPLDKMLEMAK